MAKLKPGMVGFTQIGGVTGFFVNLGQALIKDASRWTHAFIVISPGLILEAMPSGARFRSVTGDEPNVLYADFALTDDQRFEIHLAAARQEGVKYGFSTYLSLALVSWGFRPKWLERYISTNGRMICSQLVDEVLRRVGYHVFDDGRAPHDVTPGDLFYAAVEQGAIV